MGNSNTQEQANALWVFLINRLSSAAVFFSLRRLLLRLLGIRVAPSASIHRNVEFLGYGKCSIGKHSVINRGCIIDNRRGVVIGSNVNLGPFVSVYSMGHNYNSQDFSVSGELVTFEDYSVVFARAMVMPGVRVGAGAVILPGAVVTRSIPPFTVYGGVPARQVAVRNVEPTYNLSYKIWFSR